MVISLKSMSLGAVKSGGGRPPVGAVVGVRMSGRLVRATVIERIGPSGSLDDPQSPLVRVRLGDPLDPSAPELDVPREWLEPLPPERAAR